MSEQPPGASPESDSGSGEGELTPVRIIDTTNRRVAAAVYLAAALAAAWVVAMTGTNLMWLTGVLPLLGLAVYQFIAGRHMGTTDMEAIKIGSAAAPFDVGHASATLGFTGLSARPVWQVLAFESGSAPEHQALVTVDALTGQVTGTYAEAVPAP